MRRPKLLQRVAAGQALVEFAFVLPLLILMLVGVFDMGRAVFAYNQISNAARTAARVAIVNQDGDAIQLAATTEAVGLTPLSVAVTHDPSCASVKRGCVVTVDVSYAWQAATPIVGALVGPITLSSDAKMPIERVFAEAPSP